MSTSGRVALVSESIQNKGRKPLVPHPVKVFVYLFVVRMNVAALR